MRRSIPLRVVLVHTAFAVGAAALAGVLVWDAFEQYQRRWTESVRSIADEALMQPFANEMARALLLRVERGYPEEVEARDRETIDRALAFLLRQFPGTESLVIVDRDRRIRFASDVDVIEQGFAGADYAELFAATETIRRPRRTAGGTELVEVMVPVFDTEVDGGERRRLGSVLLLHRPNLSLAGRLPRFSPPTVETRDFIVPVLLFLAVVAVSGALVATLTGLPVRRLERALSDFKHRGFRGGFDTGPLRADADLASAAETIRELGGKLEALDIAGREREALLATLGQALEEGMLVLDRGARPVAWNPAALRMLHGGDGDVPTGEARERMLRALMINPELVHPTPSLTPEARRLLEVTRADGSRCQVQVTQVPYEPTPGETGTLLLIRDVDTFRMVESQLLESGRYAAIAHVGAGLAHEIRNPLHAIGLNAGVVEQYLNRGEDPRARKAMSESLSSIKDETRRLTELLNSYLGLVRTDTASRPVDLAELCRRVRQLLAYAAARSGVEVQVDAGDLPPVEGVASQLQQAVLNLVLNAIQAMPDGGTVRVTFATSDDRVCMRVSDSGPGVPAELETRLFDVRVTTKPQGSGLGLPLVRLIAESHGGLVRHVPNSGRGATFELRLPLARAESPVNPESRA